MTEKLKLLLNFITDFGEEPQGRIVKCFKPRSVKQNSTLLSEGEVCKEFYFVHTGCLRTYFITKEGHEKTRLILPDMSIGTALTSFIEQKPSFEFIDALEDTELLAISHKDFYQLNKEEMQWKEFYRKILEMAYSFQNRKIESLVTLSAKQRYEAFVLGNPGLVKRLSNKVLATYLDITQETLSRLRSGKYLLM
jgi:CRP-like cAMP-binding protein